MSSKYVLKEEFDPAKENTNIQPANKQNKPSQNSQKNVAQEHKKVLAMCLAK